MIILSHRGFWQAPAEKNTTAAFQRTVDHGFGTETDFRDAAGDVVIAHDPPRGGEVTAAELLGMFAGTGLELAVNVKADGISGLLGAAFAEAGVPWFAFDMSVPETVRYARAGLPFFTRHSDVEPEPVMMDQAQGVWLDAFDHEWFDAGVIDRHLRAGKRVCVVSSELHGRDTARLWDMLDGLTDREGLMLCTDVPVQAKERFGR